MSFEDRAKEPWWRRESIRLSFALLLVIFSLVGTVLEVWSLFASSLGANPAPTTWINIVRSFGYAFGAVTVILALIVAVRYVAAALGRIKLGKDDILLHRGAAVSP